MLTLEMKVNGMLIAHIYIVNVSPHVDNPLLCYGPGAPKNPDICNYEYEIYRVGVEGGDESVVKGKVKHNQTEGAIKLVQKVTKHATRKRTTKAG